MEKIIYLLKIPFIPLRNIQLRKERLKHLRKRHKIMKIRENYISEKLQKNIFLKDKTIAVALFGVHYNKNYIHWFYNNIVIDFRLYAKNIKLFYNDFKTVDYYIATNHSDIENELYDYYKPNKIFFTNEKIKDKNVTSKILKIVQVLKCIQLSNKKYNYVSLSRFDIYYMYDLINIDPSKMNIMSILEEESIICDNFYLFPYKYLNELIHIYENINKYVTISHPVITHGLKNIFEDKFGINYLKNENKTVFNLSSYHLHI